MRKPTQQEFDTAYNLHQLWLSGDSHGQVLNFPDCDLTDIIFPEELHLDSAELTGAELNITQLVPALLSGAENISTRSLGNA